VQDEDALVEAARTDRAAFGRLYDRHFDAIYNYIFRRVGDQEAAEDLTSATWERALSAIERYEVRGLPFAAWLYRIAGNLVANHHRERSVRKHVPFEPGLDHGGPDFLERSEARDVVRGAMERLSEADREVLSLCYFAGLSPQETADVLGCSIAAMHKRLHRARVRLRNHLEELSRVRDTGPHGN
jgi:RNA polymerase sigma-70 factor (ECF subfamily)